MTRKKTEITQKIHPFTVKDEDNRSLEGRISELEELLQKETGKLTESEHQCYLLGKENLDLTDRLLRIERKLQIYKDSLNQPELVPWLVDQIEYYQGEISELKKEVRVERGLKEANLSERIKLTEQLRVAGAEKDKYEELYEDWKEYAEGVQEENKDLKTDKKNLQARVYHLQRGSGNTKTSEETTQPIMVVSKCLDVIRKNCSILDKEMAKYIKGQDGALAELKENLIAHFGGLGDDIPTTFFLHGPTGCGKTYTAEILNEILFKGLPIEPALMVINGGDYQARHEISKLKGSPPGYVGYDEDGKFLKHIEENPIFSIVLIDEVEKAHEDFFSYLLRPLDKGNVEDGHNEIHYMNRYVFMLTSNAGEHHAQQKKSIGGFGRDNKEETREQVIDSMINSIFPPEFRGRIDSKIHFDFLTEEATRDILEVELKEIYERAKGEYESELYFTDEAKNKLLELGFSREAGARDLKRVLKTYIQGNSELLESLKILNTTIDYEKEKGFFCDYFSKLMK